MTHKKSRLRFCAAALAAALIASLAAGRAQTGPRLVRDIRPGATGSAPAVMTDLDGIVLFRANDGTSGAEIWRSDGTAAGTVLVKDLTPGSSSGQNGLLFPHRGRIYFYGGDLTTTGFELSATDGTAAGTVLIRDIDPGSGSSQILSGFVEMDGILYFGGFPQGLGMEVWRTDGTTLGTTMVKDLSPGSGSGFAGLRGFFANVNGVLLFSGSDGGSTGGELYRTNGTAATTALLKDINTGSGTSSAQGFTPIGKGCVFTADDGVNGFELWFSDTTTAGTVLVKDIQPGSVGSRPGNFVVLGSTVLFRADDGTNGAELWRTDGTGAGTTLVKDIAPGPTGSNPMQLVEANGVVFFFADDGTNGLELWRTDGTAAGTTLVADIAPGSASGVAAGAQMIRVGDGSLVTFAGNDGQSGVEPWLSDGTSAGTRRIGDINPGASSSNPMWFAVSGSNLFFQADDGQNGPELWAVPLKDLGATVASPFGFGCQGAAGVVPKIGRRGLPSLGNANFGISVADVMLGSTFSTTGALLLASNSGAVDLGLGCRLHVPRPFVALPRMFFASTSTLGLAVPSDPALLGVELFAQWLIRDAGAPNGVYALSDALHVILGS